MLLLDQRGIGHGATAFTVFAGSVVVARLLLGRLPDSLGARRTALGAGLVQGLGLVARRRWRSRCPRRSPRPR